jgi:4a-hydroxytetrahydrobiopterin dehydratase
MTQLLSDTQIADELAALPTWSRVGDEIRCEFQADDFLGAMALTNAVAVVAQAADHHPDIDIRYDRVLFALSSHSDGGLTGKDFALAREIDAAAAQAGVTGS